MPFVGSAQLDIFKQRTDCLISLDPDNSSISVQFPQAANPFEHISNNKIFDHKYNIYNINIKMPYGAIKDGNIKNLLLVNFSPGTMSVFDSSLVRALSIFDSSIGISKLTFVPSPSLVSFSLENEFEENVSELYFRETRLRTKPRFVFRLGNRQVIVSGDRDCLLLRSNRNLLAKRESITRAIGLMQRGRALFRAGSYKKNLHLNFVRQERVAPLGPISDDEDELSDFFSKYVSYEDQLSGNEFARHRLAIEYLIDGCAGLPSLEHKVISLYNSLEIIDGSRTLNKTTIASTLGVSMGEAELINEIRNALIHRGITLYQSVEYARNKVLDAGRLSKMPFKFTGARKTAIALGYHQYFLGLMIAYVAKTIGFGELPSSYRPI